MQTKLLILFALLIQTSLHAKQIKPKKLIDEKATTETKALFANLDSIAQRHVLFGQQDATLYGHSWTEGKDRSDVKDICGSHPAVIGLDFMGLVSLDKDEAIKSKNSLIAEIRNTYLRGGVVTICWHTANPANDGSFYYEKNPIKVVADILPLGKYHDKYKSYLNDIATVANEVKGLKGEAIPMIFRPFHEFDGDWFWWGKSHCSHEQFIQLWQFTVTYLRDVKDVHNFIYAFSPDCKFTTEEEFLDRYPGDEYIDMLGMDNYSDFNLDGSNSPRLAEQKLQIVSDLAKEKGKLAALTETGLESIPDAQWFTKVLLPILKNKDIKLSYMLVWRNAHDLGTHYYAPFPEHPAADDFVKFYNDDLMWFESDLFNLYQK